MKYIGFFVFSLLLAAFVVDAQAEERGIGVSPAKIEIAENVEWPYTIPITVTNFSAKEEHFEVLFEKNNVVVSALPGRFILESGASGRTFITFEEPRQAAQGLVKIVSTQTSPDGFTTGTGIKIPFVIEKGNNAKFLASAAQTSGSSAGGFSYMFGIGLILVTIVLLWYFSNIVRSWILSSNKR